LVRSPFLPLTITNAIDIGVLGMFQIIIIIITVIIIMKTTNLVRGKSSDQPTQSSGMDWHYSQTQAEPCFPSSEAA